MYTSVTCSNTAPTCSSFVSNRNRNEADIREHFFSTFYFLGEIVFYVCMVSSSISFLELSIKWPKLMKEWANVEISMKSYGWPKNLDLRLKIVTVFMFVLVTSNLKSAVCVLVSNCKHFQFNSCWNRRVIFCRRSVAGKIEIFSNITTQKSIFRIFLPSSSTLCGKASWFRLIRLSFSLIFNCFQMLFLDGRNFDPVFLVFRRFVHNCHEHGFGIEIQTSYGTFESNKRC